ncbi:hypothetical protein D3C80_758660 [compost metagenome]
MTGAVQPDLEIVAGRRAAHFLAKQPFDLPTRQASIIGDLDERQRLRKVVFHQFDDRKHLGILHPETRAKRQALPVMRVAHTVGQLLLADPVDEVVAKILAYQVEHHVERCRAAGAGIEIAVDLIEIGIDLCLRKGFGKTGQVFPVDRTALAVEQARLRQDMRSGAQAADGDSTIIGLAQPRIDGLVVEFLDIDT